MPVGTASERREHEQLRSITRIAKCGMRARCWLGWVGTVHLRSETVRIKQGLRIHRVESPLFYPADGTEVVDAPEAEVPLGGGSHSDSVDEISWANEVLIR